MAKKFRGGAEDRELRRPEDVVAPYDVVPYEDLQEAPGRAVFTENDRCRRMTVLRSEGFPRETLGTLVLGFKDNKQLTLRCE